MELALVLVLLVIAEIVVSVWMLARHKSYLKRVSRLEKNVRKMAEVLHDLAKDTPNDVDSNPLAGQDLASLVAQATPEDVQKAHDILAAMGLAED